MCPAAGTLPVHHAARAAVPPIPPDPLQVADLEHAEADDPEPDARDGKVHRARVARRRAHGNGPIGLFSVSAGPRSGGTRRPRDPDHVLTTAERAAVEPAVERLDLEARRLEESPPLRG